MLDEFWPLATFAVVATVTPGGANMLATASGAHFGFRRSIPLLAGIAGGLASMAAAASAGLAGLLLAEPALQTAMRSVGTLYLLWLAWKIGRSGPPRLQSATARATSFAEGVWLLWQNPKGWAITFGAAASFAALADGPMRLAGLLGATFGVAAAASLAIWCVAGQLLARLLRTDRQWRLLNAALALLLAASIVPMWL